MKPDLRSARQVSLFILFLLFIGAAAFEFLPVIAHGRNFAPEGAFAREGCDCLCISRSRPWYGTFNYWLYLCIAVVPLLVLFMRPVAPIWEKIATGLAAVGLFYLFLNLAVHLQWDIWNSPFMGRGPTSIEDDDGCINTGDGGSLAFALLFGWVPACLYTAFCLVIRWAFLFLRKKYFCKSIP